jgi:putative solute:sodium symporter small subunit
MSPSSPSSKPNPIKREAYWRSTRRFTLLLLALWFFVTFTVIFFARPLSQLDFFGWSFSYYMAAQGTIFIYVIIVGLYAWRMARLDKRLEKENGNGK